MSEKTSNPDNPDRILRGAEQIADEIQVEPRRVYTLASDPNFPIKREGRILVASRRALRAYYGLA